MEDAVLTVLQRHIDNLLELKQVIDTLNQNPAFHVNIKKLDIQLLKVNDQINKLQNLKVSLYDDLTDGTIDKEEFFELKQHYTNQMNQCENQILEIKREQERIVSHNFRNNEWIDCFLEHRNITKLDREMVLKLIDRIEIYGDFRLKVAFSFQYDYELALKRIQLYQQGEVAVNG